MTVRDPHGNKLKLVLLQVVDSGQPEEASSRVVLPRQPLARPRGETMSDEDKTYLAVRRVDELLNPPLGVAQIQCSRCKAHCWLAQSSVDLLKRQPDVTVVCAQCIAAMREDLFDDVRMTPNAKTDIEQLKRQQPEFWEILRRSVKKP